MLAAAAAVASVGVAALAAPVAQAGSSEDALRARVAKLQAILSKRDQTIVQLRGEKRALMVALKDARKEAAELVDGIAPTCPVPTPAPPPPAVSLFDVVAATDMETLFFDVLPEIRARFNASSRDDYEATYYSSGTDYRNYSFTWASFLS